MKRNEIKQFLVRYWLILLVSVLTGILIILYLATFNGGLSEDHSKWGEFGSFFGALTGLLAFIGVIITLIQSRRQVLASEERETFFSLLDIFREHRKNVKIDKSQLVNEPLGTNRKAVPNEFVSDDIAFKQVADESNFYFLEEILKDAPRFITIEEMMTLIPSKESALGTPHQDFNDKRHEAIKALYIQYNAEPGKGYVLPLVDYVIWQGLAYQVIQYYVIEKKYDALSYAMMRAGDTIYSLYKNQLGPYHRNIFYVFDIITKFKESNNYGLLFRAQLSKDELIIVFFNSFSIESNPTARKYFLEGSMFNNLAWNDVWITQPSYYVDDHLLGELYKAADEWFMQDRELKRKLGKIE